MLSSRYTVSYVLFGLLKGGTGKRRIIKGTDWINGRRKKNSG